MAWLEVHRNPLPGTGAPAPNADLAFEHNGVLVVVHSVGRYPELVNDHGESSRSVPHIVVLYDSSFIQPPNGPSLTYHQSVEVHCMTWSPTQANLLVPFTHATIKLDEPIQDKQPLIDRGLTTIDAAIEMLADLPARIAADSERIAQAETYPEALSRTAYEAAC